MQTLVCIDDTDCLGSRGTGHLAAILADDIEERGWGKCFAITRHQLFVHPDIPYTSHNSAMCFAVDLDESMLDSFIDYGSVFLRRESAEGSDPGFCVVVPERLGRPEMLVKFGYKAKKVVLTKQEAYDLARQLGVHLSEHGGTGGGVIGALAGTGLRLSGNDGRFRGKLNLGNVNEVVTVSDILLHESVDLVKSLEGDLLSGDELVRLGTKVKAVLQQKKSVLLVSPVGTEDNGGVRWRTCIKEEWKMF